jgi:hypothetical protein
MQARQQWLSVLVLLICCILPSLFAASTLRHQRTKSAKLSTSQDGGISAFAAQQSAELQLQESANLPLQNGAKSEDDVSSSSVGALKEKDKARECDLSDILCQTIISGTLVLVKPIAIIFL